MYKTILRTCSTTALLCLLFIGLSTAQTFQGRVQGIVTDASNAVLIDAPVTLLNVKTNIQVVRKTTTAGLYLFDGVDPGLYSVTVDAPGFSRYTQENVLVQAGGDVTVNVALTPKSVVERITVTETPVAVEFNSTNKDLVIDNTMTEEVPKLDRNPFKLDLLLPSAVNTRGEVAPFLSWSMNSVDLGGGTNLANDIEVDGSPVGVGYKGTYPPNTDAVQEVIVSQNSVDAESGHSAGGAIRVTTKSGTDEWHGTGLYLGRYPWLSALADRTQVPVAKQSQRLNVGAFTLGNPIIKNKLFNFFSLEWWKVVYPRDYTVTVPTALEKTGDFSQSFNSDGTLRVIYDPYTSTVDSNGNITRQPFPGNKIPSSRFDPISSALMQSLWAPNTSGVNASGLNNYHKGFNDNYHYYNFDERMDYQINDKWKVFGRFGHYQTSDLENNPTPDPNTVLFLPHGTSRAAWQFAGHASWTLSPRTVFDVQADWHSLVDAFVSAPLKGGLGSIWPNNNWYQNYTANSAGAPLYFPALNVGNSTFGGTGFYWDQRPKGESIKGKISQQHGSHYLKLGMEYRKTYGFSYVSSTTNFAFPAGLTAQTVNNPNPDQGDPFASFLLGALDNSSTMIGGPAPNPNVKFWGMFVQDDWKLNRRITLNLGLRDEYETATYDPTHNFSQGLDLNQPIPQMQANPPQMPAAVSAIIPSNYWKFNGAWNFTSSSHPGMWNAPKLALQPRAGIAIRLDDKTSVRVGYARYTVPTENFVSSFPGFETVSFLEPPFFGFTGLQSTAPLLQGIPQETFADPFPSSNPLLPIVGKAAGTNANRGQNTGLLWYVKDFKKANNDRLNISFQRQLPAQFVFSASYFLNLGHQLYNESFMNHIDPQLQLKYQANLAQSVANPFYHYQNNPALIPGPLYNTQTVSLGSLLVPYPQYPSLAEFGHCCAGERYNSVEFRLQRPFTKGSNLLFGYVYIHEKSQMFLNDEDVFLNQLRWQDSDQPRHRVTAASTYELPVGKGRTYLSGMPKAGEFLVGGWMLTGVLTASTGDYPRFGNMIYNGGDPCAGERNPQHWFNTSAFSPNTAFYALQTNPLQFSCLTGPNFWTIDGTLSKDFHITERIKTQFAMKAYNATNRLNRSDPVTDVTNTSLFGKALYQGSPAGTFGAQGGTTGTGNAGRQVELQMKIIF